MDNNQKFCDLRKEYPVFVYKEFSFKEKDDCFQMSFVFQCNDKIFTPSHTIEKRNFFIKDFDKSLTLNIVFNIGMVEMISYWKCVCSPVIKICCGYLDDKQKDFYRKLYYKGLGEFFYINKIDTDINTFTEFEVESSKQFVCHRIEDIKEEYILPIGGGKDSVVTLELLRAKEKTITPMIINPRGATIDCTERALFNKDEVIMTHREISPLLLELNKQGYLNGHTPFSAMLAFNTLLISVITNKKYIALSNEKSADEPTDTISGVNHQYSKSLEFENDFRAYYKEYICPDIEYFSFLRPVSELKIAQMFSLLDYWDVFKSCNAGSKQDIWCGRCPKCLFAYIILSPFADNGVLQKVFNKNLYEDEALLTYFKELTGINEVKPFECVGTRQEVNCAVRMYIKRFGIKDSEVLLKEFEKCDRQINNNDDENKLLNEFNCNNNLPEDLKDCFSDYYFYCKKAMLQKKICNKRIAVMGFGREGQSSYKLITSLFKDIRLIIYDKNIEKLKENPLLKNTNHILLSENEELQYLNDNSDLVLLTPGIALQDITQIDRKKITNQADIFLQIYDSQTIGISGTKGKSTTSTLVYTILKENNVNTLLAGNIGVPLFEVMKDIKEDTVIVAELSCHQLQIITKSPKVSVLLNLYEEHLDHYNSFLEYRKAKMNLLYKGTISDVFIYNSQDNLINEHIKEVNLQRKYVPFSLNDAISYEPEFLKGEHNKLNIVAAIKATKAFGIKEEDALPVALKFKGLAHRLEYVDTINGITYYNDSISTVPQSTIAAVKALKDVDVLILGGMDRTIDYREITAVNEQLNVKNFVFTGVAGQRMKQEMDKKGLKYNCLISDDWQEIVEWASRTAKKDSIVLLSPAASSYDKFKNFEHRGQVFVSLVEKLKK